jgi:hypothetical protein
MPTRNTGPTPTAHPSGSNLAMMRLVYRGDGAGALRGAAQVLRSVGLSESRDDAARYRCGQSRQHHPVRIWGSSGASDSLQRPHRPSSVISSSVIGDLAWTWSLCY